MSAREGDGLGTTTPAMLGALRAAVGRHQTVALGQAPTADASCRRDHHAVTWAAAGSAAARGGLTPEPARERAGTPDMTGRDDVGLGTPALLGALQPLGGTHETGVRGQASAVEASRRDRAATWAASAVGASHRDRALTSGAMEPAKCRRQSELSEPALDVARGSFVLDLSRERAVRERQERARLDTELLKREEFLVSRDELHNSARKGELLNQHTLTATDLDTSAAEAQALAEAVQASAAASASGRAATVVELNSLRKEVHEIREFVVREAEQRVNGIGGVTCEVDRLNVDSCALREELQLVSTKSVELRDLYLSIQSIVSSQADALAKSLEHHHAGVDDVRSAQEKLAQDVTIRIECCTDAHKKHLEDVNSRFSELRSMQDKQLEDVGVRIKALANSNEGLTDRIDLRSDEEDRRLKGSVHIGQIGLQIEELWNLYNNQSKEAGERAKELSIRIKEVDDARGQHEDQVRVLIDEVSRAHADAHKDAAAQWEGRFAALGSRLDCLAGKVGQQVEKSIRSHIGERHEIEGLSEKLITRIDALAKNIADEARIRQESVLRLEAECQHLQQEAAKGSASSEPTMVSPEGAGAASQLQTLLQEVRVDAERAENGRREEASKRHEAELALMRLRGELDGLREDAKRRDQVAPMQQVVNRTVQMPVVEQLAGPPRSSKPLVEQPVQAIMPSPARVGVTSDIWVQKPVQQLSRSQSDVQLRTFPLSAASNTRNSRITAEVFRFPSTALLAS